MEQTPSSERAQEIAEQERSRKLLEEAARELEETPVPAEKSGRESFERFPDDVPVWKPDTQGNLKKTA